MMRITDALVTCHRCGAEAPCGEMTMNDAELWECDDTAACAARPLPRVEQDGNPIWIHNCAAASLPEFNPIRVTLPVGSGGWLWTRDGGLTPSILCRSCGVHGFWVGGEHPSWQPA